jgi:ribonucleoside-triphosphate reductase (thioredoxin)
MNENLSDFVFTSKYARLIEGEQRRETYVEAVDRMLTLHDLREDHEKVRRHLVEKRIAASQRALQFGGDAIREKNARIYNCTVSFCDRPAFFAEAFYLLLCGCGVGFSVQRHHVASLIFNQGQGEYEHLISDSIEGWADAVRALANHYFNQSPRPLFSYELIRGKQAKLRHGGLAPSHEPLQRALEKIDALWARACYSSVSIAPIDAFDATMHLADAVLSGGVRRSATIAIFSIDDEEMTRCKTGNWFVDNPQRGRANISAMCTPDVTREQFDNLFKATQEYGEPAFIFSPSSEYINNPCVEITMCPLLITQGGETVSRYTLELVDPARRAENERKGFKFYSGWQMCNLTTVNAAAAENEAAFLQAVRCAAILGTHQARFVHFPYLGSVTERIVKRESLLGVSITGLLAQPDLPLDEAAHLAVATNQEYAARLKIPAASRVTCVKPEGTASLVLGTSAGVHPYHAREFIRRVQAQPDEDCFKRYEAANPSHCVDSVWGNDLKVIEFACTAPPAALVKDDLTSLEHLEIAKRVNQDWVRNGTAVDRLEGANHNVSITVTVDDWVAVRDYLWANRDLFTGVSLLAGSGDYDYKQAPYQQVYHEPAADDPHYAEKVRIAKRFKELLNPAPVLYDQISTDVEIEAGGACSGGACDLPYLKG